MKKIILCLLILLFPLSLQAATHTAASVSYADVLAAYNAASPGDTVAIPAGSAAWNSETLAIIKEITVQGTGISGTTITSNSSNTIMSIALTSDVAVQITGIHFQYSTNNGGGHAIYIIGKTNGSFAYTKVRIHNNKFEKGTQAIYAKGWVESLIDNNEFLNNNVSILVLGDNNVSWTRTIIAGTANSLFIEDNTFTITNSADREPNQLVYHQNGGRSVTRYNDFVGSAYTDGNCLWFDTHGNQTYYDVNPGGIRGQPLIEFYHNTLAGHHSYRCFDLRGGSALIHNNTFTMVQGTAPYIDLTEEEAWQTAMFNPLDTVWPAEDQMANTFIWSNTSNGSPITGVNLRYGATDLVFIQEGRDYFMHEPQPSGVSDGYTYYDDRQGAAGNAADGTLIWDGAHANAYYPYTAYTYPHPLRGGTAVTISNSKGGDLNESDIVGGVTVYYTIIGDTFAADSVTSGNTNDFVQAGFSSNRSDPNGFVNTVKANFSNTDFVLNSGATRMAVWWADGAYDIPQTEEQVSFEIPGGALTSGVTTEAGSVSIGVEASPAPPAGVITGVGMVWSAQGRECVHDKDGVEVVR